MAGKSTSMSFHRLGLYSEIAYCNAGQVRHDCSTKPGDDGLCRNRSEHSGVHEKIHDAGYSSQHDRNHPSLAGPGNKDTYCGDGARNDPGLGCYQQVAHSQSQQVALNHRYQTCRCRFCDVFNQGGDFLIQLDYFLSADQTSRLAVGTAVQH